MFFAVLIDDDTDDLLLLEESIREREVNMNCIKFTDPIEAIHYLDRIENPAPDFIFLDINMPKMNGLECLLHIRSKPKFDSSRILILSTTIAYNLEHFLAANGADFMFEKPTAFSGYERLLETAFKDNA